MPGRNSVFLAGAGIGVVKIRVKEKSSVRTEAFSCRRKDLLRRSGSLLLDTGFLTRQVAQVVDACTTYDTDLVDLDLVDVGRIEGEDTLDTHAVRNLGGS